MDSKETTSNIPAASHTVHTRSSDSQDKIVELVVFSMGDEEFAANIDQVREVITRGTITPIPDSPDFVEGITNVRGEITVAVDLEGGLSLESPQEGEGKHIIITEQESSLFGLIVDEVTQVLRIPESQIRPTPEAVTRMKKVYVNGVITLDERLTILLDLSKVLSEESLARLTQLRLPDNEADPPIGGDEAKELQQAAMSSQERQADITEEAEAATTEAV